MKASMPCVTLRNGVQMPQLGLGVWQAPQGAATVAAVKAALDAGYRHIDTAMIYENEASVGRAIRESTVPRHEVFVTTKLWNSDHGYEQALAAFERSRTALGLDYVDLYLIHWPRQDVQKRHDTWRALEHLYEQKKVRAIGVSNFEPHHLRELLAVCKVPPMVNQVELHPLLQQTTLRALCHEHNIAVTAYCPLAQGRLTQHDTLSRIGAAYKKTAAQVVLRWHMQHGIIAIPKSVHAERIRENANIFDFALSDADMAAIDALDTNGRFLPHPDTAAF